MATKNDSPLERVQSSYRQLSVAATTLNTASDELGRSVAELDSALKKLKLGISSWVQFDKGHSEDGLYYSYSEVGYAKIGGKWGIALGMANGFEPDPDGHSEEHWLFNDAPRELRVRAIKKIPDLLDRLSIDAVETTTRINEKAEEVRQFASAISTVVDQTPKKTPQRSRQEPHGSRKR